ncbi:hypothetical protein GCM10027347_20480 [Larkinella harenae]
MVYRLAETYLLRAEAHQRKGNALQAADDINVGRVCANAKSIAASQVTIDFILDSAVRYRRKFQCQT